MPNIFTILSFCFKILIDICKSSFSLIKNIICEKTINTQIIELDMNHAKHDFHIMILAHSITMTPGSITIFQNEKKIIVHCLYKETATEISK
jgi:multicomponent Na+:H+ antiporter subunit E